MKQIEIIENKLIVSVEPAKKWVKSVLIFLLASLVFLTLFIFYSMVQNEGLHLLYFIGLIILALMGWHFIRMIYWNNNGKEIFTIENHKLKYIADYGKFKDGAQEINLSNELRVTTYSNHNNKYKSLLFKSIDINTDTSHDIKSVIKLPINEKEIYLVEDKINMWLKKNSIN